MQQLIAFLLRYNSSFTFVLLELIALSLYFNFNPNSEKAAFISSANYVVGGMYETTSQVFRYWNLSAVNDSLARENARLKMQLPNALYSAQLHVQHIQDSLHQQQFKYTAAVVVNNSINRPNNFITINRGSKDGIRANTGVVNGTGDGIVGIVRKVSRNYAVVMSILHKDTRISAKIKNDNYFGVLTWDGNETMYLNLEALPKHAPIAKGDTIVTSGYSTIFPEGVIVGRVDTFFIEGGSNFYTARVRLSADMANIQHVHVVDDLFRDEREQLEEEVKQDE